jgi:hypothetical protein
MDFKYNVGINFKYPILSNKNLLLCYDNILIKVLHRYWNETIDYFEHKNLPKTLKELYSL